MNNTVTIHKNLTMNFIIVIVLLSSTILLTMAFATRSAIKSLSEKIIDQTIDQTERKLTNFFEPVSTELLRLHMLNKSGHLDQSTPEEIMNQFMTTIKYHPQISAIMLADDSGREHRVQKKTNGWVHRQTSPGLQTRHSRYDDLGQKTDQKMFYQDYDPRQRPWFINALQKWKIVDAKIRVRDPSHLITWTEPYQFHSSNRIGTTISIPYRDRNNTIHVTGIDILFKSIQSYVNNLNILNNGQVIILTTDEKPRILVVSQNIQSKILKEIEPFALLHESSPDSALIQFSKSVFKESLSRSNQPILRFKNKGETWWGSAKLMDPEWEEKLLMCVIVPESDLLGNLENTGYWIIIITCIVLFFGLFRAMLLARKFTRPIEFLVASSQRISKGDFKSDFKVESHIYELKELEKAHNRMRTGLKTLMKMETDIQIARDIQQKTFPRVFPEIKGYEMAGWNAPADQTGGDTFDVVGYTRDQVTGGIQINEDKAENINLLLSDATGHGIGPALVATQLRAMFRTGIHFDPNLEQLIHHINAQLYQDLPNGRFISAWFGKIEYNDNILSSFSAGQAPLLHYTAQNNEVTVLSADTFPLGIQDTLSDPEIKKFKMNPGDIFAVMSDGIFEAANPENKFFGQDRVVSILKNSSKGTPVDIINEIRAKVESFTGDVPAVDDRTILIVKRT